MELIVLIFLSIGPAVVWVWYFKRYDRKEPEPTGMLARAFVAGLLAVIPAGIIEVPLAQYWGQVLSPGARLWLMVLGVGLIEELAKFLAVYFTVYKSSHFDGPLDGIIYTTTAAFGFAGAENFLYTYSFGWEIGPLRAIITSLAHASFSGVVGFSLGMLRIGAGSPWAVIGGLLAASLLHGVYNFILFDRGLSPLLALVLVLAVYRYLVVRIRQAQTRS